MTAKELKEALANVPDDECGVTIRPTDYAEYNEEYNEFVIH